MGSPVDVDLDNNGCIDIAFGGTNASSATAARTSLGLAIGTNVEAAQTAASQAEMAAGTEIGIRSMSPLRVAQGIAALQRGIASQAEAEAGADNTKDMTPLRVSQAITVLAPASSWDSTARTSAPASPEDYHWYIADESTWDPLTLGGSTGYFVFYTGSSYVGFIDLNGNLLISSLPATVEVDGSATDTLTAVEMHSTIVSNVGQGTNDVVLTLPAAAAGLSALFQAGEAQAGNDWKARAGAGDKIYVIAADGSVTAGSDNGYFGFAAVAIGNSFAIWSFKSGASTYDWMAKAICGTCEATAPA